MEGIGSVGLAGPSVSVAAMQAVSSKCISAIFALCYRVMGVKYPNNHLTAGLTDHCSGNHCW